MQSKKKKANTYHLANWLDRVCSAVVVSAAVRVANRPTMCCAVDSATPAHMSIPMCRLAVYQSTSFRRVSLSELLTLRMRQPIHWESLRCQVHLYDPRAVTAVERWAHPVPLHKLPVALETSNQTSPPTGQPSRQSQPAPGTCTRPHTTTSEPAQNRHRYDRMAQSMLIPNYS